MTFYKKLFVLGMLMMLNVLSDTISLIISNFSYFQLRLFSFKFVTYFKHKFVKDFLFDSY